MYRDAKPISGRKLVPGLAIGCFLFTVLGLVATWLVANAMTGYLRKIHPSISAPKSSQSGQPVR